MFLDACCVHPPHKLKLGVLVFLDNLVSTQLENSFGLLRLYSILPQRSSKVVHNHHLTIPLRNLGGMCASAFYLQKNPEREIRESKQYTQYVLSLKGDLNKVSSV